MRVDEVKILNYVENSMPREEREAFERKIDANPELKEMVQAMRASTLPYAAAFNSIALPELSDDLRDSVSEQLNSNIVIGRPSSWLKFTSIAAMMAMSIGLGVIYGGHQASNNKQAVSTLEHPLVDAMATYQALYSRDTVNEVFQDRAASKKVIDSFSTSVDKAITIPNLSAFGYEFRRVQPLQFGQQTILQFVYLGETGAPIAVCITAGLSHYSDTLTSFRKYGLNTVVWSNDGITHMLMGQLSDIELKQIAKPLI